MSLDKKEAPEPGKQPDPPVEHLNRLVLGFALIYVAFTAVFYLNEMANGRLVMLSMDYMFFIALSATIFLGKDKIKMIGDFGPPILLLFAYDAMRGYADNFNRTINYMLPINFDKFIGMGNLPTQVLQNWISGSSMQAYIDIASIFLYSLHFIIPLIFGYLLWLENPKQYHKYIVAMLILSYSALLCFWLFPVAPPWMAAERGMITVEHRFIEVSEQYHIEGLPNIYWLMDANPVAAIPSLHFAYSFLPLVYSIYFRKRIATIFFSIYALAMSFSLVYLGEHYVTDLIIGGVFVLAIFFMKEVYLKDNRILNFYV